MLAHQPSATANPLRFQHECLNLLSNMMDVSSAVAYMVDEHAKPICYETYRMQPAMHRDYLESYQKLDPLYPGHFQGEQEANIVRVTDLVPFHQRGDHAYCKDFLEAWQVKDNIELFFRVDGKLRAGASILINNPEQQFLSAEMKKLESLHRFIEFSLEQSLQAPRQLQFDQFCDQHQLTTKERMVAELVVQGLPNKKIAQLLCCGLATVKTHLQHIFAKLSVNSKAEVVSMLYMMRH